MTFASDSLNGRVTNRNDRRRHSAVILLLILSLFTSVNSARADAPLVDITAKSSSADIAGKLPTSGSFVLQYTFEGDVADATVDIWPERVKACKGTPPESGSRQTYHLSFSL